jgi:Ca2+-binding RTX toxin-like protein
MDFNAEATAKVVEDGAGGILLGGRTGVSRFIERERVVLGPDQLIHVDGSDAADTISATQSGDSIVVTLNGQPTSFAAASVAGFAVAAARGDNVITLDVDLPAHVTAEDGNDSIRTAGADDTIECGPGDDTVDAGAGDDVIFGDHGIKNEEVTDNDSLYGGAGNDRIFGDEGQDSIAGGDGNDRLYGGTPDGGFGSGNDSLSGNAGNDTLDGGDSDDRVAGNGGRDRLFGGDGDDRIYGGASGDWLYGEAGRDQLFGGGGADRLYADDPGDIDTDAAMTRRVDTLHGNAGNDTLISKDALVDYLFGDGGHDSAIADTDDLLMSIEAVG